MSTCDDINIETGLRKLAADDNLARLEAELEAQNINPMVGFARYLLDKEAEHESGIEIIDGYRIGPDGEVLEYVGESRFAIDYESAAEWVLERRQDEEARIVALKARREAILANLDREIRHHEGRVKALDYRFAAELEAFARARLSGKRRTWTCPYGSVAFRHTKARWTWSDAPDAKERAVRWAMDSFTKEAAERDGMIRVKTEVTPVLDKIVAFAEETKDDPSHEHTRQATWIFLSWVPEGEKVTISTGVK